MIYKADILFLLWSRTIPENPFVMETKKKKWNQVEGKIKGVKIWNDGSQLWQIAFNLKTIQERSWYLLRSRVQVLWGVLSALSETNLELVGHSDREGFQRRRPGPLFPRPSPFSPHFHLTQTSKGPIRNPTVLFCIDARTHPETTFPFTHFPHLRTSPQTLDVLFHLCLTNTIREQHTDITADAGTN